MQGKTGSCSTESVTANKTNGEERNDTIEISDLLPLELIKSETIPPSPNRSVSTIDWLPDFAGYSWIAYGASSLLVISHFPSPLSQEETSIGPFFRQVIELSSDESAVVKAAAWSPVIPSKGELAAVLENCICLYSANSGDNNGSSYWRQDAVLVQSYTVEAIKWTGSGDGIIAAGIEVVLWKRKNQTWEIAWKFRTEQPQNLVSATWTVEGPAATAACLCALDVEGSPSLFKGVNKCVLVCQNDGKTGFWKAELNHPQPVSMIQWRPLIKTGSNRDTLHPQKDVLLTCCLDGTVRLWSEIDSGRGRKFSKDINDQKTMRQSFHVTAVIEINQSLRATLGKDAFVTWAMELTGTVNTCIHETPGRCEWLIGFGPGMSLTFWAVHCLDDTSPLRFPRVTLWKRQELPSPEGVYHYGIAKPSSEDLSLFYNAVTLRSKLFGPPTTCSLIQLLPCNSMSWLQLYTPPSSNTEDASLKQLWENCLSCCAGGVVSLDGHNGKILQVAVHPYSCEVELAVSLDSNGLLLFWSLSATSNCMFDMPMVVPHTWKLLGRTVTKDLSCFEYSSVRWAPSVLDGSCILLMGHAGGIDCFIIQFSKNEERSVLPQKLCTIPFSDHSQKEAPTNIFAVPLPSACSKRFISNDFMLLGVWMKEFQALSWKITLHADDLPGSSCSCSFESAQRYESTFAGKKCYVVVQVCSEKFPDFHSPAQVTSVGVVCSDVLTPSIQRKWALSNGFCLNSSAYHMATGYADGTLKLWRSIPVKSSTQHPEPVHLSWELVGKLTTHEGPVSAIALSGCGQKLATVCAAGHVDGVSTLHIWESNELRVYAKRRCGTEILEKPGNSLEMHVWLCIAVGHTSQVAQDFLWGPRANPVLVHERYFSVFSQWSFHMDKNDQAKQYRECEEDNPHHCMARTDRDMLPAIFAGCISYDDKFLTSDESSEGCKSILPTKMNMKNDHLFYNFLTLPQQQYDSDTTFGPWTMLEVEEKLHGVLPVYHPESLLMNICSGNWKRAYIAVQHLVGYLTSDNSSACEEAFNLAKRSHIIPQIHLANYLEELFSTNLSDTKLQWGGVPASMTSASQFERSSSQFSGYKSETNATNNMFTSTLRNSEIDHFIETLNKVHPATKNMERLKILAVLDLLGEIGGLCSSSAYGSLDEPGRRFWVAVRFQKLYLLRRFGRMEAKEELPVESRFIGWAFHSDCQETLFNSILPNEPSWPEMRSLGVGFWFSNAAELRIKMEKLARLQYLKNKDPKDCALLYIALNRLKVLAGLFKISKDEKDKPLVGFLSRNFEEEKNKAAALKNAYVLMGRHQLELAIAFFLLGGDHSSAITVCAKNLGDEQLALVICRLVEGNGGPLERQLISKFLLPAAIEKGDYWLASHLEWVLGNYCQSFLNLLGFQMDSVLDKSDLASNPAALSDPYLGHYCLMLATKNSMRNSLGETASALLARWATWITVTALNRCALPLEALECLSSSLSIIENKDQGSLLHIENDGILRVIFKLFQSDDSNWVSGDVAFHLEYHAKLDLAMQYISKLIMEHPSWSCINSESSGAIGYIKEYETQQYKLLLKELQNKLNTGLATFQQKYSLNSADLINLTVVFSSNNGLFLSYNILHGYAYQEHPPDENCAVDDFLLHPSLLKATQDFSYALARYIVACTCMQLKPFFTKSNVLGGTRSGQLHVLDACMQSVQSARSLNSTLKAYLYGLHAEHLSIKVSTVFDLLEYYAYFASAWLKGNLKGLILVIQPILSALSAPSEFDIASMKKLLYQRSKSMAHDLSSDDVAGLPFAMQCQLEQSRDIMHSIPEEEKWQLIDTCLWWHLSKFMKAQLQSMSDILFEDCYPSSVLPGTLCCSGSTLSFESDGNSALKQIKMVSVLMSKLLMSSVAIVSSSHSKRLASFLRQKVEKGLPSPTLAWLEEYRRSQSRAMPKNLNKSDSLSIITDQNPASLFKAIWENSVDPKELYESFAEENINWMQFINQKPCKGWSDMHKSIMGEYENGDASNNDKDCSISHGPDGRIAESSSKNWSLDAYGFLGSGRRDSTPIKEVMYFQPPKDIYKKNGELLEAMCINSIDQRQIALASNHKGISFFNWKDEEPLDVQTDYIWSEADWPKNGWAGSESTPIHTFVSPGVGLGRKKGAHLGLGGAVVGLSSLSKPGRDMTGGGAFGIPGYAGIGASGFGWGIQEDFEDFVDPPATVENISTRALSSHPLKPFFLVGSRNTHVYLWEFGKDRATATYGVLPAANIPPPYALASISALKFDHCGHRFATAALDGTVCTWQLEVGGRSNVCPTESALCFNSHASDASYVAPSGSIIAAAGYSSNGVNVVIWDTLAPSSTSQASLICHEGGARSLSVFDNHIGSGSISPLIVTGGKGGDVGVHDFRFIATGRTKRHRLSNTNEQNIKWSSPHDTDSGISNKSGEQSLNGMLWYIPKAHLGSVTRISTIPNTSLFLTGSKDGDVKLWDAKRAKLIFHWPKLHGRHTFLQPSSRGFGGIGQAAITDILILSHGFLTCGGDGIVKFVQFKSFQ
uniref:RAVE complex protein Rav1 C-terminal domain-containing protein n=1 Tax=Nelumbo nucifera TaxID=4432 RepID=A0A822XG23_NELNU|nr:TPA_asm: hypothetical protein HUJ06_019412 [Nelumbo nucifera]